MNARYTAKHWLKLARWRLRRGLTALRWGPDNLRNAPIVLGNAMPKSGSHLINQILQGLTDLGPFVNPGFPPVTRAEDNSKLSDEQVLKNILRMQPGDIGYGYVSAKEPFLSALTVDQRATIFVYRDPRDMIVSHIFYATEMHPDHWMHRYYTQTLDSMEARINAAIRGVQEPGSELTPVGERYRGYMAWLDQPIVLSLRFEELILNREAALSRLLEYLQARGFEPRIPEDEAIRTLSGAVAPKKSGTFRKGVPGNWRQHFTPANIAAFKQATGDLLIRLGYEKTHDW